MKEEKGEDLVLKILEVLNSDIAEGRIQKREIVSAHRVGKKDMFPRLVVVQFLDKNVRESIWVKRYNLGKKSKFFVEMDLSFKQRFQLRQKIAEIKEYKENRQEAEKVRFHRFGQYLLINGKKYQDFSVDIESFITNS